MFLEVNRPYNTFWSNFSGPWKLPEIVRFSLIEPLYLEFETYKFWLYFTTLFSVPIKVLVSTNTKDTKHKSVNSCVCTKHKHGFVFCGFCDKTEWQSLCFVFWEVVFCVKMIKNRCDFGFFILVFCVRHKHKTSFWCKFWILTSYLSRKPFASC